jgi:hypothetical protein
LEYFQKTEYLPLQTNESFSAESDNKIIKFTDQLKSILNAIRAVIRNENTIITSEKGTIIKLAIIEINEN